MASTGIQDPQRRGHGHTQLVGTGAERDVLKRHRRQQHMHSRSVSLITIRSCMHMHEATNHYNPMSSWHGRKSRNGTCMWIAGSQWLTTVSLGRWSAVGGPLPQTLATSARCALPRCGTPTVLEDPHSLPGTDEAVARARDAHHTRCSRPLAPTTSARPSGTARVVVAVAAPRARPQCSPVLCALCSPVLLSFEEGQCSVLTSAFLDRGCCGERRLGDGRSVVLAACFLERSRP